MLEADRALVERAAHAMRYRVKSWHRDNVDEWALIEHEEPRRVSGVDIHPSGSFNPLRFNGDAFRVQTMLAMTLMIDAEGHEAIAVWYGGETAKEPCKNAAEAPAAARRAVTRLAAAIADRVRESPTDGVGASANQTKSSPPTDETSSG